MKKYLAALVALITSVTGFVWTSVDFAYADSRISASVSAKTVFLGTPSTISTSATLTDRLATAEWANFKFELSAVQKTSFSLLAVFTQQNTAPCGGTTSAPSGGAVTCTVSLTSQRNVLYATNATGTGAIGNSLKITQIYGDSQIFRIRGWVDRNNNDQVDAYEPASTLQSVNTVDPRKAKAYYNFEVDPPRYSDGKVTAWIGGGSSSTKAVDMMDPNLISMRVHSCGTLTCTRVSGATTYNLHPQLLRYEFNTAIPATNNGSYAVELFYQQDQANNVLLETKYFDYKVKTPSGITTEIVPQPGTALLPTGMSPGFSPRLRTTVASPGVSTFVYKAVFSDENKALVSNRPVYVVLNASELQNSSQLRVNGVQVATAHQDQIYLRRDTDANGVLTLNIQYSGRALEQLKIDVQINGMRPYEFATPASEEAVIWDTNSVRTIGLTASAASGSSTSPISLSATIGSITGGGTLDGSVLFFGDDCFTFDTPVAAISYGSVASTIVRISNFAQETGSGFVYAQALSSTGWISAKLQLSWKGYGSEVIVGIYPPSTTGNVAPTVPTGTIQNQKATIESQSISTLTISNLNTSDSVSVKRDGQAITPERAQNRRSASLEFQTSEVRSSLIQVLVNGRIVFSGDDKTSSKNQRVQLSTSGETVLTAVNLNKTDSVVFYRDGLPLNPTFMKLNTAAFLTFRWVNSQQHNYQVIVNGVSILSALAK